MKRTRPDQYRGRSTRTRGALMRRQSRRKSPRPSERDDARWWSIDDVATRDIGNRANDLSVARRTRPSLPREHLPLHLRLRLHPHFSETPSRDPHPSRAASPPPRRVRSAASSPAPGARVIPTASRSLASANSGRSSTTRSRSCSTVDARCTRLSTTDVESAEGGCVPAVRPRQCARVDARGDVLVILEHRLQERRLLRQHRGLGGFELADARDGVPIRVVPNRDLFEADA